MSSLRKRFPLRQVVLVFLPGLVGYFVLGDAFFNPGGLVSITSNHKLINYLSNTSFFTAFFIAYVYGVYPVFIDSNKYFTNKGDEIIIEFQFIKKILTIWFPIFIFITIFNYVGGGSYLYSISHKDILLLFIHSLYVSFGVISILPIIGGLLRIITLIARKEFWLYFARGCCTIISKSEDCTVKMNYLVLALDSYNKYLRRIFKFEIKDIQKIYSKLLSSKTEEKANIIESISASLEEGKLELATYLLKLSKIPETELFIREPFTQKIRKGMTVIAVTVPIVIAITQLIQLILRMPK